MRILVLIIAITLMGCTPQPQQEVKPKWFDLPAFIDELVLNMNTKNHQASKAFHLNLEKETKEYESSDSMFWAVELTKLREINLNSPQVRDAVSIHRKIKDDKSNLLIDEFMLSDDNTTALKILRIYYLADRSEIRQIYVALKSNNFIEKSTTKINLWLNRYNNQLLIDSLEIAVKDQTLLQSPREYNITTRMKW